MKPLPLLLLCCALLSACNTGPVRSADEPPRMPTALEKRLTGSAQSFGLKLFRQMSSTDHGVNQFISPVSVALALGMTLNGADGSTYDSMKAVLELNGLTDDEMNESYRSLTDLLLGTDRTVTIEIANSAWYRAGFTVEQSFFDVLTRWYGARVQGLDFSDASASHTINQWVNDATHGRITTIVPPSIPAETVLYLINALYFKGTWSVQFDPALTRTLPFTLADRSTKNVLFMTLNDHVPVGFPNDGTTVLELPYGAGSYRMLFLLPPPGTDLDTFIAGLTDAAWQSYISSVSSSETTIWVPKFRMEYERSLKEDLTAMGMGIAFTGAATFTRIHPVEQVLISEVKHKTFVQVDEEGTEAAAVTSVEISLTSAPQSVMLNRPFVFAIRDAHTGTLVFIGRMMDPEWEER